ncbi:leucyl aminopeptidase [Panaeolus papilionaceus]|nr:leucyl aminopeptidase [Panaeolus papilionaceus]
MSTTAAPTSKEVENYRLPTSVKPTHYDVTLRTDLEAENFAGLVKINLNVKEDTKSISFNTSELELGKATLYSDALKKDVTITFAGFERSQERTTYELSDTLPAGSKAELKISFSGKLTGSMMGYYKSSWEKDGKKINYTLTQFEPTAARRAFPCWDEPLLKATFAITLISRVDTVNLSNMPVISEEVIDHGVTKIAADLDELVASTKNDQWKITKFDATPTMSTYIVAFANGHFKHLETSVVMPLSGKTVPLRIYATPDVIHQAQFALDVKASVLPLYEKIFDVEYPLPKLDTLVASDFLGAMENWGLIIGGTNALLLDPKHADLQAKKNVAETQSHEVSHMWFGNITTMEWWNYLYLNEGFATLMGEVIIPGKFFPDWRVNSQFITEHLNNALSLDAKESSHPIEVDCPDANDINQIFDALSYSKAASVLRMLANHVGEEKFLKGVSLYLKKHLFGNSVTHDLWEGISAATDRDIAAIMENWIAKIGFPVITVTEVDDGKAINVRQDRFLATGSVDPKDNETIWVVPLGLLSTNDSKSSVNHSTVLSEREKVIPVDTTQPFKLNAGTTGVYRVLYTPERLAKIAAEATKENSAFSLDDRIGLVHDSMALSKAGLQKLSSALTLVDLWKNEKEYLVWQGIGKAVEELISIWWENPEVVNKLNAFSRKLFVPLVEKLGYEYSPDDSPDVTLLRTLAITQSAAARDSTVVKVLQSYFQRYLDTGNISNIPADILRPTFAAAVQHGGRKEWEAAMKSHNEPTTPSEKIAAIYAMGASEDPDLAKETLKFMSMKSKTQDMMYFFGGLGANFKHRRLLTKYMQDNYDALLRRFEANYSLTSLVTRSTNYYSSMKDYAAIEAFYKDKDTSKYNKALAQALDTIRARAGYIERSNEDLIQWLNSAM